VYLATPRKGGGLYVVERAGRIRVVRHGKRLRRPFLDIARDVITGGQRGLLSIAFAPDYARSGLFYVFYTAADDTVRLDEFRRSADPNRADPASRRPVLNIGRAGPYHHGGQLQFGPDGLLYVSTGVTDMPPLAQDLGDLHGKLLRIDPRAAGGLPYSIPAGNPFVATAGARPEVWASGLRNPWRFSFDRLTGDLLLGDVGADTAEEVDFLAHDAPAGANFGFDVLEGDQRMHAGAWPASYVAPVIVRRHEAERTACAVIGGYVVRDRRLRGLYGRYLYADLCSPSLRSASVGAAGARRDRRVKLRISTVISFAEDSRGRIYAVSVDSAVYRLVRRA
jgi:glucose/arabinose dehydrogenase